jgi:hypothetical protein
MTETNIDHSFVTIDTQTRNRLWKCYETFLFLTDETAFEQNAKLYADNGIYPLYVGEGENRKLRGVRLGKSEWPMESGAVCLQAMVHTNEPAGLAGLQVALNWWNGLSHEQKSQVSGDVYLLFAGEHKQAHNFFKRAIEGNHKISIEELTSFRLTSDGKTNRNRIPFEKPDDTAPQSQKELWDDYQWLKKNVYSKCITTRDGENPGFITGLHTFSQPAETNGQPYFFPFPEIGGDKSHKVISEVKDYVIQLYAMMGAKSVIIENHHKHGENYFEGVSAIDIHNNKAIPADSAIPGTFECGQHLSAESPEISANAVLNSLEYKFGYDLVYGAKRSLEHKMAFCYDTQQWFTPGSPRAGDNPKKHREWLMPSISDGESYGTVHLITGNELTDSEKNMKPDERRKPDGLKHVSNEVWKMIANPSQEQIPKNTIVPEDKYDNVWDAIVNATPNQLANDAELKEGQCFAYVDIVKNNQIIRQELLYAPHSGIASMFPLDPSIPGDQSEFVAMVSQRDPDISVHLPQIHDSEKSGGLPLDCA